MGTLEDVAAMRREGRSDQDISMELKKRGLNDKEVSSVLSQTKIKDAVSGYESQIEDAPTPQQSQKVSPKVGMTKEYEGMSPSLMSQQDQNSQQQNTQEQPEQYDQNQYQTDQTYSQSPEAYQQDYGYQPQYSSGGLGSEVITEIADQIVSEKLSPLMNSLDKILDLKSATESNLINLDERLKRIEKVIDKLQLALLQRVGEFGTNLDDVKKELIETQKTFRLLLNDKEK